MCDEEGVLALVMMKMMMAVMMLMVTMRMMTKMGMRVGMLCRLSEICANAAGSTVERTGLRMIFPGNMILYMWMMIRVIMMMVNGGGAQIIAVVKIQIIAVVKIQIIAVVKIEMLQAKTDGMRDESCARGKKLTLYPAKSKTPTNFDLNSVI